MRENKEIRANRKIMYCTDYLHVAVSYPPPVNALIINSIQGIPTVSSPCFHANKNKTIGQCSFDTLSSNYSFVAWLNHLYIY